MAKSVKIKLIKLFEGWLDGSIKINDVTRGICSNVSDAIDVPSNKYARHYKTWSKYSGNEYFPIPHPFNSNIDSCRFYFDASYPRWQGKSKELRLELIDFIIEEVTKELEQAKLESRNDG